MTSVTSTSVKRISNTKPFPNVKLGRGCGLDGFAEESTLTATFHNNARWISSQRGDRLRVDPFRGMLDTSSLFWVTEGHVNVVRHLQYSTCNTVGFESFSAPFHCHMCDYSSNQSPYNSKPLIHIDVFRLFSCPNKRTRNILQEKSPYSVSISQV